jgi:hypothetical protein
VTAPVGKGERPSRTAARATAISAGSRAWWGGVRDWIEAATDQSLDDQRKDDGSLIRSTRAWVWTGKRGRNVTIEETQTIRLRDAELLRANTFQAVLDRAGSGDAVPSTHLFLRSARQARWRDQRRSAVLDAATAAELALTELLDERLSSSDPAVVEVVRGGAREMGRLVGVLKGMGETRLPDNLQRDLINVRNRAIHGGDDPSAAEAGTAIHLATELVELVSPRTSLLPSLTSRGGLDPSRLGSHVRITTGSPRRRS